MHETDISVTDHGQRRQRPRSSSLDHLLALPASGHCQGISDLNDTLPLPDSPPQGPQIQQNARTVLGKKYHHLEDSRIQMPEYRLYMMSPLRPM